MHNEKKRTYQEELIERCQRFSEGELDLSVEDCDKLYEFVKDVALDSFKSGVTVGKRKAAEDRGGDGKEGE